MSGVDILMARFGKSISFAARVVRLLLAAVLLISLFTAAHSQSPDQGVSEPDPQTQTTVFKNHNETERSKKVTGWQATLDSIEKALAREGLGKKDFARIREQLDTIRRSAKGLVREANPEFSSISVELEKLGPAPKDDEPPEAAAAAAERARLTTLATALGGIVKTAGVQGIRAARLQEQLQERIRSEFSERIFEKVSSPLLPALWRDASRSLGPDLNRLSLLVSEWLGGLTNRYLIFPILLVSALVWFFLRLLKRQWVRTNRSNHSDVPLPFSVRARSAAFVSLFRALPISAAAGMAYFGLEYFNMLPLRVEQLIFALFQSIIIVVVIQALTRTLLAPNRPKWRILPASDQSAKRQSWLITSIAAVFALDLFLNRIQTILFTPLPLSIIQSFIFCIVFTGLLIAILLSPVNAVAAGGQRVETPLLGWLKLVLWLFVIVILGAAFLGYIALARFIAAQIIILGVIFVTIYLFHLAIESFTHNLSNESSPLGNRLSVNLGFNQNLRERFSLVVSLFLHIVLFAIPVPLIMIQWGYSPEEIWSRFRNSFFGFQVGTVSVSPANILLALSLFVVGIVLTRFVQRLLDRRVLSRAHFDSGMEHSLRTIAGYLGIALSALVAVSVMGLNFTNIAIVAGALSVGIGFGLQSIVNNFVSGLILLAERPIKVGDWIIVGDEEGLVRRISVRATEIETFDRSNIIVPNSELITGTVKNWTHRNPIGRIIVNIGVAYDSDADQVRNILLDVASKHPAVLSSPEPVVIFEDFGSSSLDFTLRAFLSNVNNSLRTRSELRFSILRSFRETGIEIPYPQQDLHFRDIDRLKPLIERIQQQKNIDDQDES